MSSRVWKAMKRRSTWLRGLTILIFVFIYGVCRVVVAAVVLFQFIHTLVRGRPNEQLLPFSRSLSSVIYEIMLFFTFAEDKKPFPFGPWPAPAAKEKGRAENADKPAQGEEHPIVGGDARKTSNEPT
jgi:hypothetical protein